MRDYVRWEMPVNHVVGEGYQPVVNAVYVTNADPLLFVGWLEDVKGVQPTSLSIGNVMMGVGSALRE